MESLEALDSLDLSRLGLSANQQRSFTASEDLEEKLGMLFEHFHTIQDQLSLKTSPVIKIVTRLKWLEPDAARVVECMNRIDELTHAEPKAPSMQQRKTTTGDQRTYGPDEQRKRKRDAQDQDVDQAPQPAGGSGYYSKKRKRKKEKQKQPKE